MPNSFILNVLKQSLNTFKQQPSVTVELLTSNIAKLRLLLNNLRAEHVNLDEKFVCPEIWEQPGKAPMTYIQIYQDNFINLAIFILKAGSRLPLHDHPAMHGLLKVIAGKVKVTSYTIHDITPEGLTAERHDDFIADETSECCIVAPIIRNLHEIESLEGPSAFLDVLAPPYDVYIPELGYRKCSYFQVQEQVDDNKYRLIEIPVPHWFWSDEAPYQGPCLRFDTEAVEESDKH